MNIRVQAQKKRRVFRTGSMARVKHNTASDQKVITRNTYFLETKLVADLSPDKPLSLILYLLLDVEAMELLDPVNQLVNQAIREADGPGLGVNV